MPKIVQQDMITGSGLGFEGQGGVVKEIFLPIDMEEFILD